MSLSEKFRCNLMLFKQPGFLLFVGFPKSRLFDTVQYLPKLFFFFIWAFLVIVDFIDRSFWFDGPISELSFQSATSLMKGSSCFLSLIERELVASCRTRFFPQISNFVIVFKKISHFLTHSVLFGLFIFSKTQQLKPTRNLNIINNGVLFVHPFSSGTVMSQRDLHS